MDHLKEKTIRGGFARICAQATAFLLRIGSMMILARLLDPTDFGLVGMVTAFVGVFTLFRDFGLSTATVQRETVTEEQLSTLFWINLLVGAVLSLISLGAAPLVAAFYHEPRLRWITAALAVGFIFNAAGVQHSAILQRHMRFTALAVIAILSLVISTVVSIVMAAQGYGYWALVAMTVLAPLVSTICLWFTTAWIPGLPRRRSGVRSMMRFGSTITLNMIVMYVAYNFEKVLLGRVWGADVVGIYGRAYQLINVPTDNLNSSIGEVALSALSRLQNDAIRLKSYFLKGYSLVLALTVPMTLVSALFADDLILVFFGTKWIGAVPIFRLLTPTILVFALINPTSWLLLALGMVGRSLRMAFVIAPLMIAAYLLGLPHGANGVALAYSAAMTLWVIPHLLWSINGTGISFRDILVTISRPLVSGAVAATVAFLGSAIFAHSLSPLSRLVLGSLILFSVYAGMLLYVMAQRDFYLGLVGGLWRRPSVEEEVQVSA